MSPRDRVEIEHLGSISVLIRRCKYICVHSSEWKVQNGVWREKEPVKESNVSSSHINFKMNRCIPHVHKARSHLNHILNGAVDDDGTEPFERSVYFKVR